MVEVTRLLSVKKETIYRVFSITDPGLVTFLMKMMSQMKQFKHNSFSVRDPELRQSFDTQKDFGLAKYSVLLYSIKKTNPGNFYARDEKEKQKNSAEKVIMRKLRVFKVKSVFDSITFSREFLDSVEEVLGYFDKISNNQIFGIIDEKYYQTGNVEFKMPHWFKQTSLHSFASWIVAYFEKRIYWCFKEGESQFENKMPIQLREDYLNVWNSLEEERQEELISRVVDQLDQYRPEAFGSRELIPNYKEQKNLKHLNIKGNPVIRNMNWNEIIFKLIWMLNSDMQKMDGIPLQELKDNIKRKIIHASKNGNSSFIFSCVSPNLVDSMKVEKYFMNLMVQYLHDLYIQKNIDDLTKEEQKKKGKNKKKGNKKKRTKKRKNNKKKKQNEEKEKVEETKKNEKEEATEKKETKPEKKEEKETKEEVKENAKEEAKEEAKEVIVELVEEDTLKRGNRDDFMMRLRKKIKKEGDKKGLLVPLLKSEERQKEEKKEGGKGKESQDTKDEEKQEEKSKSEGQCEVVLVIENTKCEKAKAKINCEKINKLIYERDKKIVEMDPKDTKSLCGKEEPKDSGEVHTVEEGSEYLYRSVRTTGMEAFWDETKGTSLEGDSFFISKDKPSEKDAQSERGFGRLSKGGFSFGCRSQSRREKESRSEGSKKLSEKMKSMGNTKLEIKELKIEEEIEQETEDIPQKFEIVVPLKLVENPKEEKKEVLKDAVEKKKRERKAETQEKKPTRSRKKKNQKGVESNCGPQIKQKKEIRKEVEEKEDPLVVLNAKKKKSRKSRSLCEMVEKKEKEEVKAQVQETKNKSKRKKNQKLKYKLKKSKKERKKRNEKKDQMNSKQEGQKKEELKREEQKPIVLQRKGLQKKQETGEEESKGKKLTRMKMQKWEESEEEKKKLAKSQVKKKTKSEVVKKKKVEKKAKPFKPGKWNQTEEKPLHLVKTKKSLRVNSTAFTLNNRKKLKLTSKVKFTGMSTQMNSQTQNYPPSVGHMPFGPFVSPGMIMEQKSLGTNAFSYENVSSEFGIWGNNFKMQTNFTQDTFQEQVLNETRKSSSPMIKSNKQVLEQRSEKTFEGNNLIKSQEFFSKREIGNASMGSMQQGMSTHLGKAGDPKESNLQRLNHLIAQEKLRISQLTQEAFSSFVGENIKKIIAELQSQAELLNNHRRIILNRINCIVHKSFKTTDVNVYPYGSYATGLLTPFSDLDLAISFNTFTSTTLEEKKNFLDTLENNLRLFSFVKESKKVLTASVPVVKIVADANVEYPGLPERAVESRLIKVDIIVGSYEENGDMSPAFRTTNFIKNCISFYPSFFDLALFFKFALASNNLSNAFSGGLNAYGLSILLAAFLENHSFETCSDLGLIALEFLNFLTYRFDPQRFGVRLGFNELTRRQPFVPIESLKMCAHLVIIDPTARIPKNVTPSCFRVFQVLASFKEGYSRMQNACNFMQHKLFRKLEETLNKSVSEENRIKILNSFSKKFPKSQQSHSIPGQRFSLKDNTINSLLFSNFDHGNPTFAPTGIWDPSEVLSQDILKQNSTDRDKNMQFDQSPKPRKPAKSLKTKSEIKFTHSNTTSPQSKTEETTSPSQQISTTLKQRLRKGKEVLVQLANISDFKICKEDLLRFFREMYSDLMEVSFKLNGHSREDVSGCESVVHEKLQTDMNFDAQCRK